MNQEPRNLLDSWSKLFSVFSVKQSGRSGVSFKKLSTSENERHHDLPKRFYLTIRAAGTGILVDHCAIGHGIWLDKGEFQAIIDAPGKKLYRRTFQTMSPLQREAKEIFVGEKGVVSEWKDFLTVTRLLQYRGLAGNPKVAELLITLQTASPLKYEFGKRQTVRCSRFLGLAI